MKTVLSQFCEEFEDVARPLLAPLQEASETVGRLSGDLPVCTLLPQMRECSHRLTTLAEKVADQQAYVLIFGPLKSGKSTLMNAIAAAYVSEVTALPAYPCMVYVSHAAERSFTITRYSGKKETVSDVEAMRALMEWAHAELATKIREVESRGETFDPVLHSTSAIRRVDVRVPAPDLAESSAVLVDTPGLYTRMKFGYDRMTRDFRETAACAIFVVKTDNLFLEQVFAEFNDLLALFSRIFLLVNLDSTKRDLHPDGELRPSLEGEHPERIIAAFQNLAMSAPLKAAAEEGRLGIYPVDLLQAASGRLSTDEEADESQLAARASFDRFLGDLTEYLNSTDYLVAFLGDSLRQARGVFGDLRQMCELDVVTSLQDQVRGLEEERERCAQVKTAVERLSAYGWKTSFTQLEHDLKSITSGRIATRREKTQADVAAAVDRWFEGDASFASLLVDYVGPILTDVYDDLTQTTQGVLDTVATGETAGAELPDSMREDMQTVGLVLGDMGKASASLATSGGGAAGSVHITTAAVPVRKSFLDWVFFRSRAAVRKRLFGPPDAADQDVPHQLKLRRVGEQGRETLRQNLLDDLSRFFDDALDHLSRETLETYVTALHERLDVELRRRGSANEAHGEPVVKQLLELDPVRLTMERVQTALTSRESAMDDLANRYGDTDPAQLTQPVESDGEVPRESETSVVGSDQTVKGND